MKPGIFEHFPEDIICPVCGKNDDEECVLVPIASTGDGRICEAQPVHLGCAVANVYQKDTKIIFRRTKL